MTVGQTLAHYRILDHLGRGGMGEVYAAEDLKLGRKVALKILPADVAGDPDRRKRFETEARTIATLNHPNIVQVYSIEHAEGVDFITMELVRGTTLASIISRKAVGLSPFLEIAIPLADAVSAAHQQGITHRDLKPSNVMLSEEGLLKVLDFGLAKHHQAFSESGGSELLTESMTREGHLVGTMAYMSPEQAEGKTVDGRSDIFSLGIIFYEMLTGAHPFPGDSLASKLSAILRDTPRPVVEVNAALPRDLGRIIPRCLAKERTRRYQSALDLRNDLLDLKQAVDSGEIGPVGPPLRTSGIAAPRSWRRALPWALAGVLGVTALALWMAAPTSRPDRLRRFVVHSPATVRLFDAPILPPDGSHLTYAGQEGNKSRIYVQSFDALEAKPLDGTEGAYAPFFSPDGEWIGFVVGYELKKIPRKGGTTVTLCELPTGMMGASWGKSGEILFGGVNLGLTRVLAEGGKPETLLMPDRGGGELDHHFPQHLPGGRHVLFTRHARNWTFRVEVLSLDGGERRVLIDPGFHARYVPTGHLLYGLSRHVMAVRFDSARLEVTGAPVRVLDNVDNDVDNGSAPFSVADDGTLAYVPAPSREGRQLVWVDRRGQERPLPVPSGSVKNPSLSPDGRRLALAAETEPGRFDIWVYDLVADTRRRLTSEGSNEAPVWTPDGKTLTFSSDRGGGLLNLFSIPADGSGGAERLLKSDLAQWAASWSPDGRGLAFMESEPTEIAEIRLLRAGGEAQSQPLIAGREGDYGVYYPRFSPDGRWVAFNTRTRAQVFVAPVADTGVWRQVSTEGGQAPTWSRDQRELYFRRGNQLLAVPIKTTPSSLDFGKERVLFEGRYARDRRNPSYDVGPDGSFLMIRPSAEEIAPPTVHVVLNWFEELKRRVPVR